MESSVLNPVVHKRLIEDMDNICTTANIPKHMIHQKATAYLTESELDWVRNYPQNKKQGRGLVLSSDNSDMKMMAITAMLLRNFIDARIVPLNTLIENTQEASVILVPNLYVKALGKSMPQWRLQQVYDVLLARFTQNKLSVVYIEDLSSMANDYGPVFSRHFKDHYKIV